MKKYLIRTLFVLCISFSAKAQTAAADVDRLLSVTGAMDQFAQFDAILDAQVNQKEADFDSPETYQAFDRIMKSNMNGDALVKEIRTYLVENTSQDSITSIIDMYSSPLFLRMKEIETAANDPTKSQEKLAYFEGLQTNPPSPERIQQMVEFNQVLGVSEMSMNLISNLMYSIASAANKTSPKDEQLSEDDLRAKLQAALPENFSAQLTNQMVAMFLYTYKDVSQKDMERYIEHWKSPTGQYYTKVMVESMNHAFTQMGENVGASLLEMEESR